MYGRRTGKIFTLTHKINAEDEIIKALENNKRVTFYIGKKFQQQLKANFKALEDKRMLKRYKADELYSLVMKRYAKEKPNVIVTNSMMDSIWYSVYGVLCRDGEEAARKYAETVKLLDEN